MSLLRSDDQMVEAFIYFIFISRPGHTSELRTNYKSSFVNALDPVVSSLTEAGGDASSTSTVAISTKTNR